MGYSLILDVSTKVFFEPVCVTEFLSRHLNLAQPLFLTEQQCVEVQKTLFGVNITMDAEGIVKTYRIKGLSKEPLQNLKFFCREKSKSILVADHFHEKYNIVLKHQHLPALQVGRVTDPTYLPMELCFIKPGQHYKSLSKKQDLTLSKAMHLRPNEMETCIRQIIESRSFNIDRFVREFRLQVKEDLLEVNARLLNPPLLKFYGKDKKSTVCPKIGQWNLNNKRLYRGGTVQYWGCICFSTSLSQDEVDNFCNELISICKEKGMIFSQTPLTPIAMVNTSEVEQELIKFNENCIINEERGLQLLLIILPDMKGSYGKIKRICETELGIVSQCCRAWNAAKMTRLGLESLALKINIKVGGSNTILDAAFWHEMHLISKTPTIIFGADVTHPDKGETSSPSIAAVVASMDWPYFTKYRGTVSAQTPGKEIIEHLFKKDEHPEKGTIFSGMIRELLCAFKELNNDYPQRVIFYRDGVSDGEFQAVINIELHAIRQAFKSLLVNYDPLVTIVVVQKRNHTRLFPYVNEGENINPGTIVDSEICHPCELDFYLSSHAGIRGTSRPAHYRVLLDENNFNVDELQGLTNDLCYTCARCPNSISIVAPVYYAHLTAYRARCYLEGKSFEGTLPSIKENIKDIMFWI